MANLDGLPSGCVYGFLTITRGLMFKFKPDLVYVVFDGNRDEHRLKLWPDYKQRDKKLGFDPDSFFSQRDDIEDILKALGIKTIREAGYEADDLIYAITRKHRKDKVIITSRDKDFNQLINENVTVWDGHNQVMLKANTLEKRVGYSPKQCVDYLVLTGDKSDNIPGVKGIGPATASKFLTEFGSIKKFLKNNGDFGKKGENITWETYNLNRALIDLKLHYRKVIKKRGRLQFLEENPKTKLKLKKVKSILGKYEIKLAYKPEFIETFKEYAKR